MARLFISYARDDGTVANALARDLDRAGHDVWLDGDLTGGQDWWDAILNEIAARDALIACLSPAFVRSVACGREYRYALALGRHLVPVGITELPMLDLPEDLLTTQGITFRPEDRDALLSLVRAITRLAPTTPVPHPPPAKPEVPVSNLSRVGARVKTAEPLTLAEQWNVVSQLRAGLGQGDDDRIYELLDAMRERPDIYEKVAQDIRSVYRGISERAPRGAVDTDGLEQGDRTRHQGPTSRLASVASTPATGWAAPEVQNPIPQASMATSNSADTETNQDRPDRDVPIGTRQRLKRFVRRSLVVCMVLTYATCAVGGVIAPLNANNRFSLRLFWAITGFVVLVPWASRRFRKRLRSIVAALWR